MDQATLNILTARSQADKAINSLKGILLGINMDAIVDDNEIKELKEWAKKNKDLIKRNPFNEFMFIIEKTTGSGVPVKETIEDLFWLCQKYENDNYYYNAVTADLQTLQGLCHGIISDGIIKDEEIIGLNDWLYQNEHLNTFYPYDEIRSLLLSILSDGKIEEEEKTVLLAYFNQFVNLNNVAVKDKIDEITKDISISGLCTSEPNVLFEGKTFCVTGILQRGNREDLKKKIAELGGIPTDTINKKTDYLIVGDNGNPAWAFSCYGRKVEKALQLRKEGHTIVLIHEFDFFDILDNY
ncbi:MAG: BRCT domain-containing protein [Bacteroidetes bacterium]|nr:BRCT domain-containing protein [Bacteroidota bacterium]